MKVWFQNRRTKHKRIQSDDVADDDDMTSRAEAEMTSSSDDELVNVDCSPDVQQPASPAPPRRPTPAAAATQCPSTASHYDPAYPQPTLRDHAHLCPNLNPSRSPNTSCSPSVNCQPNSRLTQSRSDSNPLRLDCGDVGCPISVPRANPNPNPSPSCAPAGVGAIPDERRHSVLLSDIRHSFRSAAIFAHRGSPFGGATATMTSSFSGT